jgi:DNA modification methylase
VNHTRLGELVYDPFLGSGTTLIAAEMADRICCGMEIEPKFVDMAIRRWQNLTRQQATLDGDGRTFAEIAQERLGQAADASSTAVDHLAAAS